MSIIMQNTWPVCGTCNSPVEKFGQQTNLLNSDVVFVAQCHGTEERVSITQAELRTMTSMTMTMAFVPATDEAVDTSIEDSDATIEEAVEDEHANYTGEDDAREQTEPF